MLGMLTLPVWLLAHLHRAWQPLQERLGDQ